MRVGWLTSEALINPKYHMLRWFGYLNKFKFLPPSTYMRVGNIAKWINKHSASVHNELYNPNNKYDLIVLVKVLSPIVQDVVAYAKKYGCKIIYDANVNYWEVWGDYDESSPKPTKFQQECIFNITNLADAIVCASTYLCSVAEKYHPKVYWIPDNVDLSIYKYRRIHVQQEKLRLVWSGMSHKCKHLMLIKPVLEELSDYFELVIVSEKKTDFLANLPPNLTTHFIKFSDKRYSKLLSQCDIIISPKYLLNGYDLGHTSYKITLGMASGLPAVASPQQSYVEAISYRKGGIIAYSEQDWRDALMRLYHNLYFRKEMGENAYLTVKEKYATPLIAEKYLNVMESIQYNYENLNLV